MDLEFMILVFGKNGQVAQELTKTGAVSALGRSECDLMVPGAARDAIKRLNPSAIINAAAYTAVDAAETDVANATRLNTDAVEEIAVAAKSVGARFIHISTDYVFDGSGTSPRTPDASTAPLGVYGATKLAGEEAIRATNSEHVILRTSWVFSAHGANFVKTMLRLAGDRDALSIVSDQIGGPTSAHDIAAACLKIASTNGPSGTYHFSSTPEVSWADFARAIFSMAGKNVRVTDIPSAEYPTPAKRPLNSRLDCEKLRHDYAIERPNWRNSLRLVLDALGD